MCLRREQYKAAMGGNTTMLIWLGKQLLGQSDKSEQTVKVDEESPGERMLQRIAGDVDAAIAARTLRRIMENRAGGNGARVDAQLPALAAPAAPFIEDGAHPQRETVTVNRAMPSEAREELADQLVDADVVS